MSHFPFSIKSGLTFSLDVDLEEYPAPEWSLMCFLSGPSQIELVSAPFGDLHRFMVSSVVSSEWEPGLYQLSLRVASGSEVYEVEAHQVTVVADLSLADGAVDPRSHAQKMLEAIEAVLERRADLDQESYTIGGRSLQRTPISELRNLREFYRREVVRLAGDGKARRLLGRRIRVGFVR